MGTANFRADRGGQKARYRARCSNIGRGSGDLDARSVVAAIADSGPAMWTGKNFGGSPEVMDYLGGPRYKKGPVIVFFVDDPENKIPLGPVEYNAK